MHATSSSATSRSSDDLRCPERRRGEVDQHRPVGDDEHVARVEPAVRDPGRVQETDLLPELLERAVVHVVRGGELEWIDGRLPRHDDRVSVRRRGRP